MNGTMPKFVKSLPAMIDLHKALWMPMESRIWNSQGSKSGTFKNATELPWLTGHNQGQWGPVKGSFHPSLTLTHVVAGRGQQRTS